MLLGVSLLFKHPVQRFHAVVRVQCVFGVVGALRVMMEAEP